MVTSSDKYPTISEPGKDPAEGQKFIQALNNLLSTARIHQDNNSLLINCVQTFINFIEKLLHDDDEVTLLVSGGGFYLQQEKLLLERNAAGLARKLLKFFEERGIHGLRFYRGTTYSSVENIAGFARLLNNCVRKDDSLLWLSQEMEKHKITWTEIIDPSQTSSIESIFSDAPLDNSGASEIIKKETPQEELSQKKQSKAKKQKEKRTDKHVTGKIRQQKKAMRTYGYAMHSLHNLSSKLSSNKNAGLGKVIQPIQKMVDLIMDDDNILLGLSTIRDYDDYTFTHSVNVAILSVCLGHRTGLSRASLGRLGLCGLFHDLGKIDVPKDVLNKPGKLDDGEFKLLKKHSLNSVRRIIHLRASFDRKSNIILAPFEHHLRFDLTGYPETPRKKPISLMGRIVAIADVYDAITSKRIYRDTFMSPDQALGFMQKGAGTDFDPILLKLFINMLGIYPLGTILRLEDNSLGIVTSNDENTDELWAILLKEDKKNGGYIKGKLINLGKWDSVNKCFNRQIVETYHASALGIQPATFLFADALAPKG